MLGRMELVVMYSNMAAHLSLCGWGDSGAGAAEHSVGGSRRILLDIHVEAFMPRMSSINLEV